MLILYRICYVVCNAFAHQQASNARQNKAEVEKARKTVASMTDLRNLPLAAKSAVMKVCLYA